MDDAGTDASAAVRATAEDYLFSWLDGDRARMESCLHPDLVKRTIADPAGRGLDLVDLSKEDMVERASAPKSFGRSAQIDVQAIDDDMPAPRCDPSPSSTCCTSRASGSAG